MLAEVKRCAENHDIKGLRYIFIDCLDVDPTFEKYKSDYEYCKKIEGLFETHRDLSGLIADESGWTTEYWEQLKLDLAKNFSMRRFEHMIKVARVVYADKVERLLSKRLQERKVAEEKKTLEAEKQRVEAERRTQSAKIETVRKVDSKQVSDAELQERKLAEKRRTLEAGNQRIEAVQRVQKAKIEAARKEDFRKNSEQKKVAGSKKVLGIALAIAAIVVVVLIIMALH